MRHVALLIAVISAGGLIGYGCGGGQVEVKTEPTASSPPPPASSSAVVEAPPPDPVAVRSATIEGTRVRIPHELEFAIDKSTFDDAKDPNKEILTTLVEFMTKNPRVTKMRIEGHTDNKGAAAHNMELSQARADSVSKWLAAHGVDASRLHTVGLGDTKPEAPNDTDANRAKNRRTEFHIEEINGHPHVPGQGRHHGAGGDASGGGGGAAGGAGSAAPPPSASASAGKK
jgi:OOP family OmpA-OmpF porin